MGLLGDFAGAFATNIGNEMYQNEQEQRAIALQEALEQRRIQREQERELRQRRNQNEDRATELNLQGPQVGIDDQGKQALLRVRAEVDPETAAIRGTRERVGDAPVTPVGRPMTIYDGPNRRSVQRYSDGSEQDLGAPSPVRAASGGGGSPDRRRYTTVTNPDGSKSQFDEQSGELVRELPAKPGKRESQADAKSVLEKLTSITEADSVSAVKDVMRANGINPDSMEVRNLPLGGDGDYLTSIKAYAKEKIGGGKANTEDKQEDAGMTLAEALDYARKKAGGKLPPDVERKIRSAYE